MVDIQARQQLDQPRGSPFPRFVHPQGEVFTGPLFRVLDNNGHNAPGESLPRLLVNFFFRFGRACDIWRKKNPLFWEANRKRVVTIAKNYVRDRLNWKHGSLRSNFEESADITLECECCNPDGSCLICEFNTPSIALLFRRELPRIRAHQLVARVLAKHLPNFTELHITSHIAEYVVGSHQLEGDSVERIRRLTLRAIWFIQQCEFAPEIESIVDREQFSIWAEGVSLALLRPYAQPDRVNDTLDEYWSIAAFLLRAHPVISLDPGYTLTIPLESRVPYFLPLKDSYPTPLDLTLQINRTENSDPWREGQPGSAYLDYETPAFDFHGMGSSGEEESVEEESDQEEEE